MNRRASGIKVGRCVEAAWQASYRGAWPCYGGIKKWRVGRQMTALVM